MTLSFVEDLPSVRPTPPLKVKGITKLVANPGKWARVRTERTDYAAQLYAARLRKLPKESLPPGTENWMFEVATRRQYDRGNYGVFMRYTVLGDE